MLYPISFIVSLTILSTSTSAVVLISPEITTKPFVASDSHATCASLSLDNILSKIASENASQALSGCPSVTDSDVNKNLLIFYPLFGLSIQLN